MRIGCRIHYPSRMTGKGDTMDGAIDGDYFSTRRIGYVRVTAICDGTALWRPNFAVPEERWRAAVPEADAEGRITIGFHVFHVRAGNASILIDAGFDDPESTWGKKFERTWDGVQRSPG